MTPRSLPSRPRGAAILTVLAVVTLASLLVVSLLQTAISEKQLSHGTAQQQNAGVHADTAFQLALAQLRAATTPPADANPLQPWTSQPGAVTRHHSDGTLDRIFKLYSAEDPVTSDPDTLSGDLPVNWNRVPGQYTDLNAPALSASGDLVFPVADPRMAGPEGAEGFSIKAKNAPAGTTADTSRPSGSRRLPMPVRWVYLLRDGTAGVLDDSGHFISRTGRATAENPMVARIAWWADDESAKINVNTAGEAAPWDTPRLTTKQDEALALNQPMRGEYHRYPGHPAGVSLSSVLLPRHRWLQPGDTPASGESALGPADAAALWQLATGNATDPDLTSMGGTRRPPGLELPMGNGAEEPWHLLASPEEILFDRERRIQPFFARNPDAVIRLRQSGFLLTSDSRSPETTLFGTPKISLWPVHESVQPGLGYSSPVQRASATDSLLALCATAGGRQYYVQRATPSDGSADFQRTGLGANSALFRWLTGLMDRPTPGFVREDSPSTFTAKYGAGPEGDAANLAALMLDYIRTTNLADGAIPTENQYSIVCPGNETEGYGQISPLDTALGTTGAARWKENQLSAARGLGRLPTISGAVFLLTCRAVCDDSGQVQGSPSSAEARALLTKPGARELEGAIFFEGFIPGQGWAESRPYCSILAAGPVPGAAADFDAPFPLLRVNGVPLRSRPATSLTAFSTLITRRNRLPQGWTASGGAASPLIANAVLFRPFIVPPEGEGSGSLRFDGTVAGSNSLPGFKAGVFDSPGISGSNYKSALGDLVQVLEFNFPRIPAGALPLPSLPAAGGPAFPLEERLIATFDRGQPLISSQDVVQSLVPAHGDNRLIAGQRVVPASTFVAHPDYGRKPLAHRLRGEPGSSAEQASAPGYFEDVAQSGAALPDFPVKPWDTATPVAQAGDRPLAVSFLTMAQAFQSGRLDGGKRGPATPAETGDFDTASGRSPDGPYINRADDGELRGYDGGGVPYFDAPPSDPKSIPAVSAAASSPNRLVPGPGMFGSLPTGVRARVPWQTLLFRPDFHPDNSPPHYGATWPPDHLLLDLFWMPVIEPYGISTPMETAGKLNLNHQLIPFSHIRRTSALHALLKGERVIAVPDRQADEVKRAVGFSNLTARLPIDADGTLSLWDEAVRQQKRPFLTPSEICRLPLVPDGVDPDIPSLRAWWGRHRLTGDNLKERPYTNLHARLTTRSNAFRVHVIAQSLTSGKSSSAGSRDEISDTVSATWRGSALIARHLQTAGLPDYFTAAAPPPVDRFYTWSITGQRRFAPAR